MVLTTGARCVRKKEKKPNYIIYSIFFFFFFFPDAPSPCGVDVKMCKLKKTWKGIIWDLVSIAISWNWWPQFYTNYIKITEDLYIMLEDWTWCTKLIFMTKNINSRLKSSQIISLRPPKSTQFLLFFFDSATLGL
jgi:hypothetical protein